MLDVVNTCANGIRYYIVLFRPPMLPEDVRYLQLTDADLSAVGPSLRDWLGFVFAVLGGFAMATGILMITLAATAFRSREPTAVVGAILGGAASIGMMTAVLGLFALWAASLIAYWLEGAKATTPDETGCWWRARMRVLSTIFSSRHFCAALRTATASRDTRLHVPNALTILGALSADFRALTADVLVML
jgi:hypothetical protein